MRYLSFALLLLLQLAAAAQDRYVAITMDDVPFNTMPSWYPVEAAAAVNQKLLQQIVRQQAPVAVFFNGNGCLAPDYTAQRLAILQSWATHPLITLGNHTLRHPDCSAIAPETFREEVSINDYIIRKTAGDKPLQYFRFPFNNMGKDSVSQAAMRAYLQEKGYQVAPFTIETMDYMFNDLYCDALQKKQPQQAEAIAQEYLRFTVASFAWYEQLSRELWGRNIPHIYLCHGNQLQADHYDELLSALQKAGYRFISLQEALKDPAYAAPVYYHQQAGFSWLFRWIQDPAQRNARLKSSPDPGPATYRAYQQLLAQRKANSQ